MERILTIVIIFISSQCWGFDHGVVKGQWAVYHSNVLSKDAYYFLNIKNDFSGTFIRAIGHDPVVRKFGADDVTQRDGYIEIKLNPNEKAILSAWKLQSGSGLLTGQVFMYNESGELFNMLYFPLQLLEPKHELLDNETIKQLSKSYR